MPISLPELRLIVAQALRDEDPTLLHWDVREGNSLFRCEVTGNLGKRQRGPAAPHRAPALALTVSRPGAT